LVVFSIASITDAYDGYVARKYDLESDYGRFLDPLADKILVSSAFISFAVMKIVPFWMVGLIISRDLFIYGLTNVNESKRIHYSNQQNSQNQNWSTDWVHHFCIGLCWCESIHLFSNYRFESDH